MYETIFRTPIVEINGNHRNRNGAHAEALPKIGLVTLQAHSYARKLRGLGRAYGIPVFDAEPEVERRVSMIHKRMGDSKMMGAVPGEIKASHDEALKSAGAYYTEFIKPLLATGRDAFKPRPENVTTICQNLAGEGVDLVIYYALSKTQSPRRTGSPDAVIDFAELEMLKHYAIMTRSAEAIGLKSRFILIDETSAMQDDAYLGITGSDKTINKEVSQMAIESYKASGQVIVKSLLESVAKPLGSDFASMYQERYAVSLERIKNEAIDISPNRQLTPLAIRIRTILDCMPNSGIEALGVDRKDVAVVRAASNACEFNSIPQELLTYLFVTTANIEAIMDLRSVARERALEVGDIEDYPEYRQDRVYGGVTRKVDRWSFMPHPIRFNGSTINPMHGLATYDQSRAFNGIAYFETLAQMQQRQESQIVYLDNKPVFSILT